MELVLMRHAPTAGNLARLYVGSADEVLSDEGEALARAVREVFSQVDEPVVYVSPLLRARQTASLCFPHAEQRVVDDLREMDFGAFEGRSYDELKDVDAYRAWLDGGADVRCPGGECQREFVRRTVEAVRAVLRECADEKRERAVVVAHGGTAMAALSELASPKRAYFDWHLGFCEAYRATVRFNSDNSCMLEDPRRM